MDPIIAGTLLSGGMSLLSGLFQGNQNKEIAEEQMAFQERMSSSAYSRATADMKNAGLNPALMYSAGGPESTPGGAGFPAPRLLDGVVSSAMEVANMDMQRGLIKSQILKNEADAGLVKHKADIEEFEGEFLKRLTPVATEIEDWLLSKIKSAPALGSSALKSGKDEAKGWMSWPEIDPGLTGGGE